MNETWTLVAVAVVAFLAGLILGRSLGGGGAASVRAAPAPRPMNAGPVPMPEPGLRMGPHRVRLNRIGENKIMVIKEVRGFTGLGLKETKDLVESAPADVMDGLTREQADHAVTVLTAAGAQAIVV